MSSNSIYQEYHYVYRITNLIEKLHYYGVRTSKNGLTPKEDLGFKYFSSSTDKNFIKDQKENPQNYRYKIVRFFNTREDAISFEICLHEKFEVAINPHFYNKAKQTSTGFCILGKPFTEKHRSNMSAARRGKRHTEESKAKMSLAKQNMTDETKKKLSDYNRGKRHTEESKAKMSASHKGEKNFMSGKTPSAETRKKISIGLKNMSEEKRAKMIAIRRNSPSTKGTKWYNDGIKSYMLKPEDERIMALNLKSGRL